MRGKDHPQLMTLLFLLFLLVAPYLILTLLGRWFPSLKMDPIKASESRSVALLPRYSTRAFHHHEEMAKMIPSSVPYRVELIYVTGILELLGAIGVWIPRLERLTGLLLIVMLIGVLPANIYSAINRVEYGGHDAGPIYLLARVPFQLFVIWWTYFATGQDWFGRR